MSPLIGVQSDWFKVFSLKHSCCREISNFWHFSMLGLVERLWKTENEKSWKYFQFLLKCVSDTWKDTCYRHFLFLWPIYLLGCQEKCFWTIQQIIIVCHSWSIKENILNMHIPYHSHSIYILNESRLQIKSSSRHTCLNYLSWLSSFYWLEQKSGNTWVTNIYSHAHIHSVKTASTTAALKIKYTKICSLSLSLWVKSPINRERESEWVNAFIGVWLCSSVGKALTKWLAGWFRTRWDEQISVRVVKRNPT